MPLTHSYTGKVREIFSLGDDLLVLVTSDRISAFDVVMAEPIPDKGRVLTAMTAAWIEQLADVAPSHLVTADLAEMPAEVAEAAGTDGLAGLAGRTMLVHRAEMLPIECIVRGYLAGSAFKEYEKTGTVHGMPLEPGLRHADRLPEPLFTPSTKATEGHDENISFDQAAELVGKEIAEEAREICLEAYRRGCVAAEAQQILVADTKFELGFIGGRLAICDEVLTPDSSRFWPADSWEPGTVPPSFDKQPLRDWLEGTGWDKAPPPPTLPPAVVQETSDRYVTAYERVCGRRLADWYGPGT